MAVEGLQEQGSAGQKKNNRGRWWMRGQLTFFCCQSVSEVLIRMRASGKEPMHSVYVFMCVSSVYQMSEKSERKDKWKKKRSLSINK